MVIRKTLVAIAGLDVLLQIRDRTRNAPIKLAYFTIHERISLTDESAVEDEGEPDRDMKKMTKTCSLENRTNLSRKTVG